VADVTIAGRHAGQARRLNAEASALRERFPPRPVAASWESTRADRQAVLARLLAPPFLLDSVTGRYLRRFGLIRVLDWLQEQPGGTWQERWEGSGAGTDGRTDWRTAALAWLTRTGRIAQDSNFAVHAAHAVGSGLLQLICGDVIRPSIGWLLTTSTPKNLATEMARVRDVNGFKALHALGQASAVGNTTAAAALARIAFILAAKGGIVRDITVGDSLELLWSSIECDQHGKPGRGAHFYQLLHAMGVFPAAAPPTVRLFSSMYHGQLSPARLIDRYDLACRPVRDLLVDYLCERQPGLDYTSLDSLANQLGLLFWKDLENHHPGIDSLSLAPDVATAWKQRIQTKPARPGNTNADSARARLPRTNVASCLNTVRAFYLDIAQWAAEDPARWGTWACRCPIRPADVSSRKERSHRKSRMDQRTRERLPVLPALAAAVDRARKDAAEALRTATGTGPGQQFTAGGQTLRRAALTRPTGRIWAEDVDTGRRRDLTREEDNAFWAWAAVEVLRNTGIRVEELIELTHHSLVQYRLPDTGQSVPLLHIAPSKTDEERLLVISPELADVLATILRRVRAPNGTVPLVVAYDTHERVWNPPMPVLFQNCVGVENRPFGETAIGRLLDTALAGAALTDPTGKPLTFVPHDFRRIFTTDAIMNGMPPHIAQLILGHRDINTTMGYKAVYPEEVINSHRAFIARRRELRPSEEYRTPTDTEWEEFLGHFERRRVALGDCGRAYATSCIHEHSCLRCPLLRPDPAQRPRLVEIRANLTDRIAEAQREGWLGEAEGLQVSLAAANAKLAQMDGLAARRAAEVHLGMPGFPDAAGRTVTTQATLPAPKETT
jgi:integrase